jgi:hypothetical protein
LFLGKRHLSRRLLTALAVSALMSLPAFAQNYLTDLGAVAPALGINNSGQVALQNYIYSNGMLTAFPTGFTAGGPSYHGVVGVVGGISSNGAIAGEVDNGDAVAVYSGGTVTTPIPNLGLSGPDIVGAGVNASGDVIGYWMNEGQAQESSAFWFGPVPPSGTLSLLNIVFDSAAAAGCQTDTSNGIAWAEAHAINDAGLVTGFAPNVGYGLGPHSGEDPCVSHAFVWNLGVMTDLGAGFGYAINANGSVTGASQEWVKEMFDPVPLGAFLYANGTLTHLPSGANVGLGINSGNYVVGDGANNAFFYNGVVLDLNSFVLATDSLKPFVTLTDARGINDTGLVVVNGVDSRTQADHAYLLQAPLIQVAPGPLVFPATPAGSTSAPLTVTFTNTGATALSLGSATITAPFAIETNTCGGSLAPSAACTVSASYVSTGATATTGTLTVSVADVPIAVPLSLPPASTAVTTHISASVTTVASGASTIITWSSTNATSCSSAGGGSDDGWAVGSRATSGSVSITEPVALVAGAAEKLTFTINCTSNVTGLSASSSVVVTQLGPTSSSGSSGASGGHGGGALDWMSELLLLGLLLRQKFRSIPRKDVRH